MARDIHIKETKGRKTSKTWSAKYILTTSSHAVELIALVRIHNAKLAPGQI